MNLFRYSGVLVALCVSLDRVRESSRLGETAAEWRVPSFDVDQQISVGLKLNLIKKEKILFPPKDDDCNDFIKEIQGFLN